MRGGLHEKICLYLFLCFSLRAEAMTSGPEVYYGPKLNDLLNSSTLTGSEIKSHLHLVLKSFHKKRPGYSDEILRKCPSETCYRQRNLGYKKARKMLFGYIDLMEDNDGFTIRSFYCQEDFHSRDFGSKSPGPHRIPNTRVLNTEHLWPQSRFSKRHSKSLQKSDLHHLQPTKNFVNSLRGNKIFGEVHRESRNPCHKVFEGRQKGKAVFEPKQRQRGDIARSLFYFSTRYNLNIVEQEEIALRNWHEEDPVDEEERQRHELISEIQDNRNPFIDYPQLVERIEDF